MLTSRQVKTSSQNDLQSCVGSVMIHSLSISFRNLTGSVRTHVTLTRVRVTIVAVEKSNKYYIFPVCVCSLSYPACKSSCTILSSVSCPALPYFSTLSHKRHDFRGGGWRGGRLLSIKICFDFVYSFDELISDTEYRSGRDYIKCT